jgi:hypothetical protein
MHYLRLFVDCISKDAQDKNKKYQARFSLYQLYLNISVSIRPTDAS